MPKKPTAESSGETAGTGSGTSGKEKKQNPLIKEARGRYARKLRADGIANDQVQEKVKAYVATSVRPALNDARAAAQSKNLTGAERKKFIEDAVRRKLGEQA